MRRAVLFHELAHIRRGDRFAVILQTLLQIVYVLNPMVWLINLRLFRYRELICDEYALRRTEMKPQDYGRVLLDFAERYSKPVIDMQLGTCFFETRKGFAMRISMLLKGASSSRFSTKQLLLLGFAVVLILPLSWQCSTRDLQDAVPSTEHGESSSSGNDEKYAVAEESGVVRGADERSMVSEESMALTGRRIQLWENTLYPEEAFKPKAGETVVYEISIEEDGEKLKISSRMRSPHSLKEAKDQAGFNMMEVEDGHED